MNNITLATNSHSNDEWTRYFQTAFMRATYLFVLLEAVKKSITCTTEGAYICKT